MDESSGWLRTKDGAESDSPRLMSSETHACYDRSSRRMFSPPLCLEAFGFSFHKAPFVGRVKNAFEGN